MPEPILEAKLYPAVASKSAADLQRPVRLFRVGTRLSVIGIVLFLPCGRPRLRAEILEPLYSSLPSWLAPGRRTALYAPLTAAGVSA